MTVATEVVEVVHERPPAEVILDDLKGWINKVEVTAGDVLVCVYERGAGSAEGDGAKKTKGGVWMPGTASRASEDKFQGAVGMIVGIGPQFHAKYDKELGLDPVLKKGDWITCNIGDTTSFVLGKRTMRLIQGNFVRLRIKDPDCVI